MKYLYIFLLPVLAAAEVFIARPSHPTLVSLEQHVATPPPPADLYIFVTPPASFMFQHISLALELWKRQVGHVLILTLHGYKEPFQSQLKAVNSLKLTSTPSNIYLWDMGHPPPPAVVVNNHTQPILLVKPSLNAFGMPTPVFGCRAIDGYKVLFKHIANAFKAAINYEEVPDTFGNQVDLDPAVRATNQRNAEYVAHQLFLRATRKLMIVPSFIPEPTELARYLKIRYVGTVPTAAMTGYWTAGFIKAYHHTTEYRTSFTERTVDLVRGLWMKLFLHDNLLAIDIKSIVNQPTLTLVFSHPFLALPEPLHPSVIYTGAVVAPEREDPKHISKTSLKLLNNSKYPTLVVSFGTYAALEESTFLKVFHAVMPDLQAKDSWSLIWALPQRQIDILSPETQSLIRGVPGRISFEPWIVLPAILAHSNLKLFVSHCGGNSLGEALRAGVPVVGLPAGAEQPWNCDVASKNVDFVLCHELWRTTADDIRSSVERILFDPSSVHIMRNAERAKLLAQRAYSGAPLAADWVQWAMGGKDTTTTAPLVTKADREGVIKALYLDVSAALIALMFIVCTLLAYLRGYNNCIKKSKVE